jgi:hypothetical protein
MEDLSKIHDCEKCHGKIVLIERDAFGNTYCGYCHERVDYSREFKHPALEKGNY